MNTQVLFQPLTVGNLTVPNRVLMTTIKLGYGTERGEVTDRHVAFYVRRAEGNAGLVTAEPLYILHNGRETPTQMGIYDDALIPGLRRLTDAVHGAGGLMMAHINHAGRVANPKLVPAAARIRSRVSIPVAVAGRIRTPDVAREALALGQADWIGLGAPSWPTPTG
ncbi:MAG: hypothetical protein R6X31_05130 [Anaerolineae bacterium]